MTSDQHIITIVSGLPRSGTSLIMQMLQAGGMELLTDNVRHADEDNPKGYYEFELVKQLKENKEWVSMARGKAIKVISELLQYLPSSYDYRVIFVERNIDEILASQRNMLQRRKKKGGHENELKIKKVFEKHLVTIRSWLGKQSNMSVLYVNYNEIITKPETNIHKINNFFADSLNESSMLSVIDKKLYRNIATTQKLRIN